ncbi:hypothetical protein PV458_27835 [Streptomyces sp. MN03-5084-2B]|nr:hypothetical protein [Streptomyces sp. MN03-5084-2B]
MRRFEEPKRPVDGRAGRTLVVVCDLSRVQSHPQPDLFLRSVFLVVPSQFPGKGRRQDLHEGAFRNLGRHQHERAVTGVLVTAVEPRHTRLVEGPAQRVVKTPANCQSVRRRPAHIAITLDVRRQDRAMNYVS